MKLKQLDIYGFKSFVEKTSVQFPEGICAVVGPNGCGKSNIVDALRWVMGEQSVKQLRGKSMEDVIFSGSEKKPPVNMAEVALTLANDNGSTPEEYRHYPEIMVSRKLYRSGESGYFINKQPCRLKDVQNLLMGSGVGSRAYAIIEQGKIGNLIDAGPEERRFFIEEAAGVTRYKSRKHEALLKIQRTQHNLMRINDVTVEVKRQMSALKRQANKAERYKNYQGQIKSLEIRLATHHYLDLTGKIEEAKALFNSLKDTDFQHESDLAKLDAAIEEIKAERTAKHHAISAKTSEKNDLQRGLDKLEGAIEHKSKDLGRYDDEMTKFRQEIEEIEKKTQDLSNESRQLEARRTDISRTLEESNVTLKEKQASARRLKTDLDELKERLEQKKGMLVNLASRKATYQNTIENASRNRQHLSKRLEQLQSERAESAADLERLNIEVNKGAKAEQDLKSRLNAITETLASMEHSLEDNRLALRDQVRQVRETELERQKVRSQHGALKKMDDTYQWFKKGVQALMKEWKAGNLESAGICGLVADIIEPEPSYEEAVEAALGETLQYVIVKNQAGAATATEHLRGLSGGRASLIPVDTIKPIPPGDIAGRLQNADGLIQHINVVSGYHELVQALLGHVRVADDLESAIALWNRNGKIQTIVTPQGDRICFQGTLTVGSSDSNAGGILTKKKELRRLRSRLTTLDEALNTARQKQADLEKEVVRLETAVQETRQNQRSTNQELVETEKALSRLQEKVTHTQQHLEILDLEQEQIEGERSDIDAEVSTHEDGLNSLEQQIHVEESAIEQLKGEILKLSQDQERVDNEVVDLKMHLTSLQAEFDSCDNTLRRLKHFQHDSDERLSQLHQSLKQAEADKRATEAELTTDKSDLRHHYAQLESLTHALADSEAEYQAIEGRLQQNDQALSEVKSRQQETFRKIQQLEFKLSERRMRRDHVTNNIIEKYGLNIAEAADKPEADGLSPQQLEERLTECRERIAKIGDVNLTAIEEYDNLKDRYSLLTSQRDDLNEAIEALHRIIRKINRVSLKRFMKTFKAVNEKVRAVFPKLFEGGTAQLALTNPKRPLDSGVSFLVRPPGKRLTRMSLLSGGEKALSAIALVFSLFLIRPTAFCILDEIDAPLDNVNISRFSQLLKEIGSRSQVVMITHDRQTMETANALFGVTMEEKGISKLVSLDFQDSQK